FTSPAHVQIHEYVPGRKNSDSRPLVDEHERLCKDHQHTRLRRSNRLSLGNDAIALSDVFALRPNVRTLLLFLEDLHRVRLVLRVFNLQYGIGALRKRRAGHDPDRLALPDRLGWKCPGRDVLDDLQDSRRGDGMNLPDIVMPDGKPIHRGIVPGWIVALGD